MCATPATESLLAMRTPVCLAAATLLLSTLAACGGGSDSSTAAEASPHPHPSASAPDGALPLRAGERFVELAMAEPYTPEPPNGGTDEYRCLILDPRLAEAQYLTGVQYEPDNAAISHHTITFVVAPEDAAGARALDAESPEEGWTCFGQGGLENATWADTWTPGAQETLFEQDLGYPVEPGSLLVLQVHYNLLATRGEPAGSDRSSVRLRLTDGTPETVAVDTLALPAPIELPCLPDESGPLCDRETAVADVHQRFGTESVEQHAALDETCGVPEPGVTQVCDYQLPVPVTVYATRGHMHLLGRSISIERNPGTPQAEVLLDVPAFNFDDQALNVLDEPVQLQAGETVRVTCTHDASLRRQLPQLESLPPRYVVWGEGTSDEMCLGLLTAAVG
jgi:hypothetical protein